MGKDKKRNTGRVNNCSSKKPNDGKDGTNKFLFGVSIVSILGSLVFGAIILTSDIPLDIISEMAEKNHIRTSVNAMDNPTIIKEEPITDDFTIENIPGVTISVDTEKLKEHLEKMDDEEFDKFYQSLIRTSGSKELTGVVESVKEESSSVADKDKDNTKDEVSTKPVDSTDGKSLEEAYIEAEKQYPGKIDASKRMTLVNELNAVDYKYYVAEEGDTLIMLSRTYNVSLGQLVEINGIHDADKIPAGMIILFPLETE